VTRETPTWDAREYLKFERERTLPCRDLVARIELESAALIADLGCGPGNSTTVLAQRWPAAKVVGIDSSEEMLKTARKSSLPAEWLLADMREWNPGHPYDLVFSNAALQWVGNHQIELPRLFRFVGAGGAFAFQIPAGEGDWTRTIREVAEGPAWRGRFSESVLDLETHQLGFYYDLLSPLCRRIDLWETQYVHILSGPEGVVEWTKGTALRPMLDRLPEDGERASFLADYAAAITKAYPRRPDGKVLFPFLRRFVAAYR
jgi:trans-aconitate 2-methyltransferase